MTNKYHIIDLEWIDQCDEQQLDFIEDLLYEDISYDELQRRILSYEDVS